jgi:HlyD family secretion protein
MGNTVDIARTGEQTGVTARPGEQPGDAAPPVEGPDATVDSGPQYRSNPRPGRRSRIVVLIFAAVVLGLAAWRLFFSRPSVPDNIITVSGRIEGDDAAIAAKTGGRILEVHVREGDSVKAGDVIAILNDDQVQAREDQARAALMQAESQAKAARDQIAILQEDLRQAQLQTDQAKTDASGRVSQAEAEVAAAEADLAQQEAAYQLAVFDKEAYTRLAQTGAASERQAKQATATAEQQAAAVAAAKRRVEAAHGALATAHASLTNPPIRASQVAAVRRQIGQQEAQVSSATAQIDHARAQLAEAQANRKDLTVLAPFTGTITVRSAEPGEVAMAGTPIVTLVDLTKVYLRGFVPEGQIGNVKVGQPARVYLDSNPRQPLDAFVSRVDPQAMFTPENTYFRDDRVKQVVGVKLQLKTGIGYAKPGMPADGEILTRGNWPAGRVAP